ncbi:MAG TPA: hypothetical protein VHY33_02930 [Thermoanaerobaculia bacterium]|nr:hypothetical protein [Thermoanaerobaculia bacterium]
MNEFRSTQPLSDDDFAAIRQNVMTTIAARKSFFPIVMRFAFAAAVVIAIGVAFVRRPAAPVIAAKPIVTKPPIAVAAAAPAPITRVVAHRPRHRRATHPRAQYASSVQQNIRVEFRTSDPDVRIIWIASQTPSTTTGGKS